MSPLVPEPLAPLMLLPDAPEDEVSPLGGSTVVVVVTLPDSLLPEPEDAAPLVAGSWVVVVVVVVCPNVADAVPISERKMAKGNFLICTPSPGY